MSKPAAGQPYILITDGSGRVRVYCSADVETGDTVAATGICSGETTDSGTQAAVLTRTMTDVLRVNR